MATETVGTLHVTAVEGKGLIPWGGAPHGDPYVILCLGKYEWGKGVRSDAIKASLTPRWDHEFVLEIPATETDLTVLVRDDSGRGSVVKQAIGTTTIPLADISGGGVIKKWYKLLDIKDKDVGGEIFLHLRYIPSKEVPIVKDDVAAPAVVNGPKEGLKPRPEKSDGGEKKDVNPVTVGSGILGFLVGVAVGALLVITSNRKPKVVTSNRKPYVDIKRKGNAKTYEVKRGDTLRSIAGGFHMSVDELFAKNSNVLANPNTIRVGDELYIP